MRSRSRDTQGCDVLTGQITVGIEVAGALRFDKLRLISRTTRQTATAGMARFRYDLQTVFPGAARFPSGHGRHVEQVARSLPRHDRRFALVCDKPEPDTPRALLLLRKRSHA